MLPSDVFRNIKLDNFLIHVEGKHVFKEGELFDSYDDLLKRMELHTKESLVYYWRRDSRTVERAFTKTSRPIAPKLKYYFVRFACIYGGMKFQTRGAGRRVSQTMRTDCQGHIMLRAAKCGTKLEVISVCNIHNHEISEKASQMLPQNRRLPDALKEEVLEMLRLKIDRKKIIEYVMQRENKKITSKDLFNMAARLKGSEVKPEESERRNKILEKINYYTTEKSIKSIVSIELAASVPDQSVYYSVDESQITEFISPEHEFVVNETIIGSMVEAQNRDYTEQPLENSNDDDKKDLQIDTFIEKCPFDKTIDDFPVEEHLEIHELSDDIIVDESDKYELVCKESPIVIYQDFEQDECYYFPSVDSENHNSLTNSDSKMSNDDGDDDKNNDDNIRTSNNGSIVLFETITGNINEPISVSEEDVQKCCEKRSQNKSKFLKEISKMRKRILKCRKCGTNGRLIKTQIDYLQAKKTKILMETKLLNLKRLKLLKEINNMSE